MSDFLDFLAYAIGFTLVGCVIFTLIFIAAVFFFDWKKRRLSIHNTAEAISDNDCLIKQTVKKLNDYNQN